LKKTQNKKREKMASYCSEKNCCVCDKCLCKTCFENYYKAKRLGEKEPSKKVRALGNCENSCISCLNGPVCCIDACTCFICNSSIYVEDKKKETFGTTLHKVLCCIPGSCMVCAWLTCTFPITCCLGCEAALEEEN
jgi:hypothetical protein